MVLPGRQRNVAVPELLCSVLSDLKARASFSGPDDFVLPSRSGTPVSQDNLATRRLKGIGHGLGIPWLSWCVFHRTHLSIFSENNRQVQNELKRSFAPLTILARTAQ